MRLLLTAALAVLLLASGAWAHGEYTGLKDPMTAKGCCGGNDCAPVPAEWVTEVPGGYRIKLSHAQAATINQFSNSGVDAFVPYYRIIPSFDSEYHLCIDTVDRSEPNKGVLCLLVPVAM